MTGTTPTTQREMLNREAQSLTVSASHGSFGRRICGIFGRNRITNASADQSLPAQQAGYRNRSRFGSPRLAALRLIKAPINQVCFQTQNLPKRVSPITPTGNATI